MDALRRTARLARSRRRRWERPRAYAVATIASVVLGDAAFRADRDADAVRRRPVRVTGGRRNDPATFGIFREAEDAEQQLVKPRTVVIRVA